VLAQLDVDSEDAFLLVKAIRPPGDVNGSRKQVACSYPLG